MKKNILYNTHRILFIILSVIFIALAICAFISPDMLIGLGVLFIFLAMLNILYLIFIPTHYTLDGEGIEILYIFGDKEIYHWSSIRDVTIRYGNVHKGIEIHRIFGTLIIEGEDASTPRFYKGGRITSSKRARQLIEEYMGKKITGFISDDIGALFKRIFERFKR